MSFWNFIFLLDKTFKVFKEVYCMGIDKQRITPGGLSWMVYQATSISWDVNLMEYGRDHYYVRVKSKHFSIFSFKPWPFFDRRLSGFEVSPIENDLRELVGVEVVPYGGGCYTPNMVGKFIKKFRESNPELGISYSTQNI